ncbi:MAG: hypothetical protein NW220_09060, partial [Leptolyngbyaceae cyanobacterium bins.349]|nr:hypothetical protein [Leptolyngbyaceae cyanobacterium bins.349]
TNPAVQTILDRYQYIWDIAIPSTAELHTLFAELGTVTPITWKRFPKAFTVTMPDRVLTFRDREQAWDWYLLGNDLALVKDVATTLFIQSLR